MTPSRRGSRRVLHNGLEQPGAILICPYVLERTVAVLSESGMAGSPHEGVVYWIGPRGLGQRIVTTCVAPGARTTYGSFDTSSASNAQVVVFLAEAGLEMLGQVHSHPGKMVDHSIGDDERAFMPYEGYFSIVVPHFGSRGMLPITRCGVHVFENGQFRRLRDSEVNTGFHILPGFKDLRR